MVRFLPLIIISLLPLLISLGHDIYVFFQEIERGFRLSSIGHTWATYAEIHFKAFINSADQKTLEFIDPLLGWKTSIIALIFAVTFPALLAIEYGFLRLCFGWIQPSSQHIEEEQSSRGPLKKKKKNYTYNRK